MDSGGLEERREPINNNAPGVADQEIGEAESQAVVESGGPGERERLLLEGREVPATQNPTGVQQQQQSQEVLQEKELIAKERHDKLRIEDDKVFKVTEEKLAVYDERERLLAETYRDLEEQRKARAKRQRERERERERERDVPNREGVGNTTEKPVKSDRNTDDDDSCYMEIKNLVLIENSVIHKKALEDWDRKEKLFTSRVERKSSKVGSLKNEVYQLIGFFSVFQGVVLTAVSQSNLLHCNNLWSPIFLSVLASIVTIAGVAQKLKQISSFENTIYSEEQALKDVVKRSQELRRVGKEFVFAKFSENKPKGLKKGIFGWYAVGVLSFLGVFTAAFPLSHWRILCHPGANPYGSPPSSS